MSETWIATARRPSVVRRAIKTSLIVGTLLVSINHGPAILAGDVQLGRYLQMLLTYFVPYAVSTTSAVSAIRENNG